MGEAWWLVFTMMGGKKGKGSTSRCKKLTCGGHAVTGEMKFRVAGLGKTRCKISVLCESYAGLDLEQDLVFNVTAATQLEDDAGDEEDDAGSANAESDED